MEKSMTPKKRRSKSLVVRNKQFEEFLSWCFEKEIFYGDIWVIWWKKKGMKDFLHFADKNGQKFTEEPN